MFDKTFQSLSEGANGCRSIWKNYDNVFQVKVLSPKFMGVDHFGVQEKQAKVEYHFLTLPEYFLFENFWHLPLS